jgi:hypothetical protein
MSHGTLAEYQKFKETVLAKIAEYEAKFAKQPSMWRKLNQDRLSKEKLRVFGPEFDLPKETRTLAEWSTAATDAQKSFRAAVAVRNYMLAARCERFAEFAARQAGIHKESN